MGQAYTEIDAMKRRPSDNYDFYYHFAIGSMFVSALTVVILAVSIPLLCSRVTRDRDVIATKSDKFREDTNRLWSNIQLMQNGRLPDSGAGGALPPVTFFSRKQRSPWSKQICSGCSPLSCPSGGPGLPGPPGEDGAPGTTGNPGKAGEDGYDVELEPEDDLPCAICPAGPPGQRGLQGERGQAGSPGLSGEQGPPGTPGIDGPPGNTGPPGPLGGPGQPGSSGPPGDQVIAGVGIKGPRGAPGPAGPKGPMGQAGKASKGVGFPGKPGPIGPPGQAGLSGRPGDEGPWGPPGEPGQPSAYCPSDCGVSQILAPALRPEASTSYGNEQKPRAPPPAPTSYGGESSPTQNVAASNDDYPEEVAPADLNEHNAALRYYYRQRAAMMA